MEDFGFFLLGVFLILILIIAIVLLLKYKSKRDKYEIEEAGRQGESIVAEKLNEIATKYGGYLFNDFLFKHKNNEKYSTEIDHILITRGGVFIIETKNNSGMILGEDIDRKWVCIKSGNLKNKTFRNPIDQNQVHINCLKRMFDIRPPEMVSIIIFVNADISQIDNDIVYNLDDAIEMIENSTKQNLYLQDFVEIMNRQVLSIKNKYSISKEEHIANIRRKYGK